MQDPIRKPIHELDTCSLLDLLPEMPLWVKNPDYDRVSIRHFQSLYKSFLALHSLVACLCSLFRAQVDWLNKVLSDMWPYLDKVIL